MLVLIACGHIMLHSCEKDWAVYLILFMVWVLPTMAALHIYGGVIGHTRLVVARPTGEF